MKILDIGAGFHKFSKDAISIDINSCCNPDISHNLNVYPWPFKENEFDVIYSSHCLEHLESPQKAIDEIYRIGKNNALVIIKVPHFSSRLAWTDVEHTRAFSINLFRKYTETFQNLSDKKVLFKVEKIKFYWQPRIDKELLPPYIRKFVPVINFINNFISNLANANIDFCERIWCYYAGGMGEVEFRTRIIKK